ncbi:hypothetical protein GUJ93_ZPchr0004g38614 [Zizania palustris]|uniref:Uncharacterized protein n=1 Tax=Zizania palustris TaxID=103762 RepID=A0A8J5SBD9_ZIZPA|nr:hypothetical protein GUJ93_ZPchr0004g38614 [Zizania palustris]
MVVEGVPAISLASPTGDATAEGVAVDPPTSSIGGAAAEGLVADPLASSIGGATAKGVAANLPRSSVGDVMASTAAKEVATYLPASLVEGTLKGHAPKIPSPALERANVKGKDSVDVIDVLESGEEAHPKRASEVASKHPETFLSGGFPYVQSGIPLLALFLAPKEDPALKVEPLNWLCRTLSDSALVDEVSQLDGIILNLAIEHATYQLVVLAQVAVVSLFAEYDRHVGEVARLHDRVSRFVS